MILGNRWLAAALAVALFVGCGQSGGEGGSASSDGSGPEQVISQFLAAIKQGNDQAASALLTTTARQKTSEMEMVVAPPGSDSATFKVLESEVQGSEAQVGTDWTDLDAEGQPHTDRIVWMLKRESSGWRICGMATRVFPDLPPTILNFEDPIDMIRKQQQAEEEIARRDAQASDEGPGEEATTVR